LIPLKDNIPTRSFPVVSVALIAINLAVFLLDKTTGQTVVERAFTPDGVPALVRHHVGGLSDSYAMIPAYVTTDFGRFWWMIFTSMFLHANLVHVGFNMLSLWIFGNNIEDTLGKARFLLFYLATGAAAAAAHIYSDPVSTIPTIGASGAVAGLMGGYLILFPHARILSIVPLFIIGTIVEVPAILVIGFWAVVQFLNSNWLGGGMQEGGGVAYFAHIGGFVAGLLLIAMLGGRSLVYRRDERPYRDYFEPR
jgi:membrane associated rhomboid family serine protease